jgi:hypothetical protein
MTRRNLFTELTEGFDALASARKVKKTLRTTEVELKPAVEISADELRAIRRSSIFHALCLPATSEPIHAPLRTGTSSAEPKRASRPFDSFGFTLSRYGNPFVCGFI